MSLHFVLILNTSINKSIKLSKKVCIIIFLILCMKMIYIYGMSIITIKLSWRQVLKYQDIRIRIVENGSFASLQKQFK